MRRKHNPYVALVALLVLAIIVGWICNGCSSEVEVETVPTNDRLDVEYVGDRCYIITDNETGVQYLYVYYGSGAGLTRLEAE